ncbi:MAG: S9 family peptidase [Saprospirales bacterium]|nr:MAG: S9 family peptidase [Saprospirales bacterium]
MSNSFFHPSLVLIIAFLLVPVLCSAQAEITVEGIWKHRLFDTRSVEGFRFMKDGRHFTRLEGGAIRMYDIESGEVVEDILSDEQLGENMSIRGYQFSEDENLILFYTNRKQQYRRSFFADYFIWNRQTDSLSEVGFEQGQMNGYLCPVGKRVGFVFNNDLYFREISSGQLTRVTDDGKKNHIINGASDWVYEEEFYITRTFDWSPDSRYLGYLRFDESHVKEFTMTDYNEGTYPEYTTFKYPKVGEENSVITVWIYDVEKDEKMEVPFEFEDIYIPRIYWSPMGELVIFTMNRHQNDLSVWLIEPESGEKRVLLQETNPYYINMHDNLTFVYGREQFIWTSEKDGFNHIYLYDFNGNLIRQLTKGEFDVTAFYGYDPEREQIFFQAAAVDPMNREIYAVSIEGGDKKLIAGEAGVNTAGFSSTFDYYILDHSTATRPAIHTVYKNGETDGLRVIEDNRDLIELIEHLQIPEMHFFSFTTSEEVELNGYKIYPRDFDPEERYPVLMYQYSGPNSQQVLNNWRGLNFWWFQKLAQEGFIIVCVDGRGTGARGEEFRKMTYLELGLYETIDQIEAAKYLASKDYVNEDAIGIFGWSYGGYISTLALLKGADVFASAIAVAPVTDWRWYDTIYTERYMRTREENPEGYFNNSPVNFAHKLEGDFLIVHGLADDNVHFQHTAEMVRALNLEDKHYDLYIYPNNNHSIFHRNARYHLYTKMTDFLRKSLQNK